MSNLMLAEAKQIDLVDYLASLGHYPQKISGNDYWFLSPLREERTASFKVDRKLNLFYDHGVGKGGSIIDFGIQYHQCTIPQLLEKLQTSFSFHRNTIDTDNSTDRKPELIPPSGEEKKIRVVAEMPITSPALIHYLQQRKIPVELAEQYCREVRYEINGKPYYAIGFKNDQGGYELRNPYFKGSCSPKGSTFLNNGADELSVFEGYFSFLSYRVAQQYRPLPAGNYLVLNSLSFFEKGRPMMEQHGNIYLFLDRDPAGMKCMEQAIKSNSLYKDGSLLYKNEKDLNQWLVKNFSQLQLENLAKKQSEELIQKMRSRQNKLRPGRHL